MSLEELIAEGRVRLGLEELDARATSVAADVARLERELEEVRRRIPLWDRMVFFLDSPDEQREAALERELKAAGLELERTRARRAAALEQLGRELPPVALAARIEAALARVEAIEPRRKKVAGRAEAIEALEAVADLVLETWTPDLDLPRLVDELQDDGRRRRAAEEAPEGAEADDRLGVRSMRPGQLLALVAARLEAGDHPAARRAVAALTARREELAAEAAAAAARVGLADKVNVFTDSPDEAHRDALGKELAQVDERLVHAREAERSALAEALGAYPPLAVHHAAVRALGVARALVGVHEPVLAAGGTLGGRWHAAPRALLLAAAARLVAAFDAAFPAVRAAGLALRGPTPLPWPAGSPVASIVRGASYALATSAGPSLDRALELASLRGGVARDLGRVRRGIGLVDRLVFWSRSAAEETEAGLEARDRWLEAAAASTWDGLLALATGARAGHPTLALNDALLAARGDVEELHTDGGSSRSPRSCAVYGAGTVLTQLGRARAALAGGWGVHGDRGVLLGEVGQLLEAGGQAGAAPLAAGEPLRPLAPGDLVRRLAAGLAGGPFLDAWRRTRELAARRSTVASDQAAADGEVSFWDRLNVFTTTPAEARSAALKAEVAGLDAALRDDLLLVDRAFDAAVAAYPPAGVAFAVARAAAAVSRVRAVCRRGSRTTGTGKNKRTETYYYCSLEGRSEAVGAVARAAALAWETFGPLPDRHDLLDAWAAAGAVSMPAGA